MIRLIAAAFALVVTTSAQAMPVAPVHEPGSMITPVVAACGVGMTRVNGVCVAWNHLRALLLRGRAITARDGVQL